MILLNPGPVNVSDRVRQALLRPDICHRESEFSDLIESIRDKLVRAFAPGPEYVAILITGSGTAAVEAALTSCLPPGRRILVVKNGVYSQRISDIANAHKMQNMDIAGEWDQRFETEPVQVALRQNKAIEVVAMVHHETSTGMLNPVKEIGAIVKKADRLLLVDGVSSLAGEEIDFQSYNVGVIAGSSGKCIQGFPGVGFVLVRRDLMEKMITYEQRSVYFHLPLYYKHQEEGSIPFTPAVQLYYAFDEALSELLEEGVANRIARYRKLARLIRNRMRANRIKFYLREPLWSSTLTAFTLPEGMFYDHLHDLLREQGYVIYAGQAQLAQQLFRVANMGAVTEANITAFLDAFEQILPEARKLGEERMGEMDRLGAERKEKEEREAAEEKAAEEAAKAEEAARKAEVASEKAEAEAAKIEGKPEVKSGA
ncbi:MAG TPA: alanine--glyoxylate aminotransferase family protein [Nitrospirales bacterium]|jgi:2-aminoethylphosphonate-pyruvate transaminase|nr:alanine--glyoxylate aminotransferase family protein [Nitrospirales bacterium]